MWRLGASLLAAVVLAVVASGWLVDRVFDRVAPGEAESMRLARELGGALAGALDAVPPDGVGALRDEAGVQAPADASSDGDRVPGTSRDASPDTAFERVARAELALPEPLEAGLDAGEPLALESADGVTLYVDMPRSGDVLAIPLAGTARVGIGTRFALTALFYLAVAALVLAWLYPLARRLARLAAGARELGDGTLAARVPTNPFSNLRTTEIEFNRMARRIERLVEDNRLLSGAVSHDLRTPLARLRFGIDALGETFEAARADPRHAGEDPLDGSAPRERSAPTSSLDDGAGEGAVIARRQRYLVRIDEDLSRMERLVDVLLEFVRLDRRLHELPLADVDLVPVVAEAVAVARGAGAGRIDWTPSPVPLPVRADARYAGMLVANLVQNAVRHARSSVHVSLARTDGRIVLRVDDDGPGIAEDDRRRVLQPFVRGEREEKGGSGGFGLGLAIVARVAEWHGATFSIGTAEPLRGARTEVAFRAAAPLVPARRPPRPERIARTGDGESGNE